MPSAFDGYYPDGYDDGDQSGTHAGKQPRKIDNDVCPSCNQVFENGGQCVAPVMRGGCPMGGDV